MTWTRRRFVDEAGLGGIEVLPFGVLTFVIGTLLVANAWGVIDAKAAATAAAREAARTFVEAPSPIDAHAGATAAAREAMAGHGRDPERAIVTVEGPFARCAPVLVRVTYPVPAIHLPWIGGFGEAFRVQARHSEIVDPYRSGALGTEAAACG